MVKAMDGREFNNVAGFRHVEVNNSPSVMG